MKVIDKIAHLQRIASAGIIAVVRAASPDEALQIAAAVKEGGVGAIEITLTVPRAIKVIEELVRAYPGGEILIGVGTVLDTETARAAMLAGAEFIVSPSFNPEVIRLCNRYRKICMPGCATATEIISALEAGADIIKLFPGSTYGPSAVKAFKGPLPQAEFIPTGGVNLDNVGEWIASGCIAVGVGSELTKGAVTKEYHLVTGIARQFVEKIGAARKGTGERRVSK